MASKTLSQLARAAEDVLGIEIVVIGRKAYHYADEASEWYALTRDDLAYAADCAAAHEADAYSHWCAGTGRPATDAEVARLRESDAGGTGNEEKAMNTIHIQAQDTLTDWFGGYVAAVEAASGAEYIGDDSQYGCFRDRDGGVWQAYVEPSRSDHETWCVTFEAVE